MKSKRVAIFESHCPIFDSFGPVEYYRWVKDKEEADRIAAARGWRWLGFVKYR